MNNTENINYPKPKREYKVLVRCFTYNHSKYIEDALNGFAIQQTDFPYVCFVMDDASTDGEQEIIKKWMERECDMRRAETFDIPTSVVIIVPHKNNQSCTFAFYLLKQNLYKDKEEKMKHVYPWRKKCEYEAICEGDDYWIDPLKLQKQVDILVCDPKVTMVYTGFQTVDEYGNDITRTVYESFIDKSRDGDIFTLLLKGNFVMTLTTCYRSELFCDEEYRKNRVGIDYYNFLFASLKGDVKFIPERTACYRLSPNGMMETAHNRVNIFLRKAFCEICRKYLTGFGKVFSLKEHFIIRLQIAQKAWQYGNIGEKELFNNIILWDKKMCFFLIFSLFLIAFRKFTNQMNNIIMN